MTRNGKIARLPREIREQLNRRLHDGETGVRLVEWLNTLPQVTQTLAEGFGGREVSVQNLSEWKQGGYQDWVTRQETLGQVRELAEDATELAAATNGALADHLAVVLTARYAKLVSGWNGEMDDGFRRQVRALRMLCQDVVELRRGDHSASRLRIERERLEADREKTEEEVLEHFQRWAQNASVREWMAEESISPAERERRLRQIFGLQPRESDEKSN